MATRRRPRPLPDILTAAELTLLFKAPNQKCPTGQRNHLMLRLMADLGLRVSEVIALALRDIELSQGKLKVRQGKGQKDRLLVFNPGDQELMAAWLETRRAYANEGPLERVFCTLDGKPLLARYLHYMVQRCGRRAGIHKAVYPHLLRHNFGTGLYRQTRDLVVVKNAMGHRDISTTLIYVDLANHEVEEALRGFRIEEAA